MPGGVVARCVWCGAESVSGGKYCARCGKERDGGSIPGKCTKCGSLNALNMVNCGFCGAKLPEVKPEDPSQNVPRITCKWCGKPALPGDDTCWECANRLVDTELGTVETGKAEGSLLAGAVLLLIAGLLALFQGLFYLVADSLIVEMGYPSYGGFVCCGTLDVVFGVGAIAGSYCAHRRTNFGLALVGAVVGMLGFGFAIGFLLGLIALILIATNRQAFE